MSWQVLERVKGSGSAWYNISINRETMQMGCSCPSWTKNMPREDCKHILKYRLTLALRGSIELARRDDLESVYFVDRPPKEPNRPKRIIRR